MMMSQNELFSPPPTTPTATTPTTTMPPTMASQNETLSSITPSPSTAAPTTAPTAPTPLNLQPPTDDSPSYDLKHTDGVFQCPFCDYARDKAGPVFAHLRKHHGPKSDNPHPRWAELTGLVHQYHCGQCDLLFKDVAPHAARRHGAGAAPAANPAAPTPDWANTNSQHAGEDAPFFVKGIRTLLEAAATLDYKEFVDALVHTRVIRTVPHSVRARVGTLLNEVAALAFAGGPPTWDSFHKLLCFLPAILIRRGSKARDVKARLDSIQAGDPSQLIPDALSAVTSRINDDRRNQHAAPPAPIRTGPGGPAP